MNLGNVPKKKSQKMDKTEQDIMFDSDGKRTGFKTGAQDQQSLKGSQRPALLSSLYSVLFVIGSALIGLTAARNSLTWHVQRFWGASGDFWQSQWDNVLSILGDDPAILWTVWTPIVTAAIYWIFGGIYTLMDITNKPSFLRKYKIQPGTNEPVDNAKLFQAIMVVLFNQSVVTYPLSYVMYKMLGNYRGMLSSGVHELPTFHWVLFQLAVLILIEEIGFYYSHRLMHHRILYKFIHKKHHEWTSPIAITSIYCHPIEHIVSNLMPPLAGIMIMKCHIATAWLWLSIVILSTLNSHSGYHLPFFPSSESHDYHHLKFNQCYGVLGVLDKFHGTDTGFRESKAFQRHITIGLTAAREMHPDDDKTSCKTKS